MKNILNNFIKKHLDKPLLEKYIISLFEYIKNKITEQVIAELNGAEKKDNVDKSVIEFIKNTKTSNPIVIILTNILIDYVPILTQCIYDYLKKYIDGLTKI